MSSINTRKKTCHYRLGQPAPLTETVLPLEVDVYNAIGKTRTDLQLLSASQVPVQNKEVYMKVLEDIKVIWIDGGSIPIISDRSILEKI